MGENVSHGKYLFLLTFLLKHKFLDPHIEIILFWPFAALFFFFIRGTGL
jgi:hypothetical protein